MKQILYTNKLSCDHQQKSIIWSTRPSAIFKRNNLKIVVFNFLLLPLVNCSRSNLTSRFGSFSVISAKPCQNALGEAGTCMFMWDCIKSEGRHLGTCSDRFLFGSCCFHNSTANDIDPHRPVSSHQPMHQSSSSQNQSALKENQKQQALNSTSATSNQSFQSLLLFSNNHSQSANNSSPTSLNGHQTFDKTTTTANLTEIVSDHQKYQNQKENQSSADAYNDTATNSFKTQQQINGWQSVHRPSLFNQTNNQQQPAPTTTSPPPLVTPQTLQTQSPLFQQYPYYPLAARPPWPLQSPFQNQMKPFNNVQQQQLHTQHQPQLQRPPGVSWLQRPVSILANTIFHTFRPLSFLNSSKQRPTFKPVPSGTRPGNYRPIQTQFGLQQRFPPFDLTSGFSNNQQQIVDQTSSLVGKNSSSSSEGDNTSVVASVNNKNTDHYIVSATTNSSADNNRFNLTVSQTTAQQLATDEPAKPITHMSAYQNIIHSDSSSYPLRDQDSLVSSIRPSQEMTTSSVSRPNDLLAHNFTTPTSSFVDQQQAGQMSYPADSGDQQQQHTQSATTQQVTQAEKVQIIVPHHNNSHNIEFPYSIMPEFSQTSPLAGSSSASLLPSTSVASNNQQQQTLGDFNIIQTNSGIKNLFLHYQQSPPAPPHLSASASIHDIQGLSTGPHQQLAAPNNTLPSSSIFSATVEAQQDNPIISLGSPNQMIDENKYPVDNNNNNKPQTTSIFNLGHGRPSSSSSSTPGSTPQRPIIGNIDAEDATMHSLNSSSSLQSVHHSLHQTAVSHKDPLTSSSNSVQDGESQSTPLTSGYDVSSSPFLSTSFLPTNSQQPTMSSTELPMITIPTMPPNVVDTKPIITDNSILNNERPDFHREVQCGVAGAYPQTKVVGGKNAAFGAWPWQVSVRKSAFFGMLSTHRCGGALISNEWIATAGHCVEDLPLSTIRIRVGEHDFGTSAEPYPHIERSAKRKVVHPKYNYYTYENDLALVQLDQPIRFPPHVAPICLPPDNIELLGRNATVTGWGRLNEGGMLPTILQEVRVPIVSNDKCKNMFLNAGRPEYIPDIFLCAGYEEGGRDSCQGDSGGPLQVKGDDGKWFLAGIISWGIGCAERNLPGVCTRISRFKLWMQSTMNSAN